MASSSRIPSSACKPTKPILACSSKTSQPIAKGLRLEISNGANVVSILQHSSPSEIAARTEVCWAGMESSVVYPLAGSSIKEDRECISSTRRSLPRAASACWP